MTGIHLKRVITTAAVLALAIGSASPAKTLSWAAGWDNLTEPLNYTTSSVVYSVSQANDLSVTYTLNGATPNKLYQVAIIFFNQCPTPPASFGTYPETADSSCTPYTRQGVTASTSNTEIGVVTTDASGDGSTALTVGPLTAGSYKVEFIARDGAGCVVSGGGGGGNVDFQSPGPDFATTTTVKVP